MSVAKKFVQDEQFFQNEQIENQAVEVMMYFHQSVLKTAKKYQEEMKRYFWVTPTNYLQLLSSFRDLNARIVEKISKEKQKYEEGVEKLDTAKSCIEDLRQQLLDLQPQLQDKAKQTENIMKKIQRESLEADSTKKIVKAESEESNRQAQFAEQIKKECEDQLAIALPELEAAVEALKTLKKDDIIELKAMQKPPDQVKMSMEAVAIFCKEKPIKSPDPNDKSRLIID